MEDFKKVFMCQENKVGKSKNFRCADGQNFLIDTIGSKDSPVFYRMYKDQ